MTLLEFKNYIDTLVRHDRHPDQTTVVIKTSDPSVGPLSTVEVESILQGFDWDRGKVIIFPEEKLYLKHKDEKE